MGKARGNVQTAYRRKHQSDKRVYLGAVQHRVKRYYTIRVPIDQPIAEQHRQCRAVRRHQLNKEKITVKMEDDDDWVPPSEAEMKVILARRERADKISKLMGQYLLKGYKMLSESCECGTILLRDKQNQDYCVACHELDTDLAKDDPALSAQAASSQLQEGEFHSVPAGNNDQGTERVSPTPLTPMNISHDGASACPTIHAMQQNHGAPASSHSSHQRQVVSSTRTAPNVQETNLADTEGALFDKLKWATNQLRAADTVEGSIAPCELIRASADALCSLKSLIKDGN